MTRQQNFFGRLVAATDLAVLFASYLVAYWVRLKLWQLAYPVLPIGSVRTSAWIITVMFPGVAVRLPLFQPLQSGYLSIYFGVSSVRTFKAQILASVLMLNAVFIIRGFDWSQPPSAALDHNVQLRQVL